MDSKKITVDSDLEKAFHIRKEVFVIEQGVPLEDEFDEFDSLGGQCEHILVYYNENNLSEQDRLRVVDGFGKLERICILVQYRKFGLGKVIIKRVRRNRQS